jgi:hypothetical protein
MGVLAADVLSAAFKLCLDDFSRAEAVKRVAIFVAVERYRGWRATGVECVGFDVGVDPVGDVFYRWIVGVGVTAPGAAVSIRRCSVLLSY